MKSIIEKNEKISYSFSPIESDILNYLWKKGEGRSRTIHIMFGDKHDVTHSTVAVILSRLYERKILSRRPEKAKGGTRFVYFPNLTREELGSKLAFKFIDFLRKNFGEKTVANLKKKIK